MMKRKTGAREAGWLMLIVLFWVTIRATLGSEAALSTLSVILIPFIGFIGYAVGLKAWSLNLQDRPDRDPAAG